MEYLQKTTKKTPCRKQEATRIELLPISEILPYAKNPRKNEKSVKFVKESIRQFGFKVPIIIDSKREIVCGHTRLLAAKSLGLSEIPCIVADDLTEEQIKAFRLADNKVGEFSDWDMDLLTNELSDIAEIDMGDFGFDLSEEEKENEYDLSNSTFQIIIDCQDELEQEEIYNRLQKEGLKCRLSTL